MPQQTKEHFTATNAGMTGAPLTSSNGSEAVWCWCAGFQAATEASCTEEKLVQRDGEIALLFIMNMPSRLVTKQVFAITKTSIRNQTRWLGIFPLVWPHKRQLLRVL